MAIFQNRLRPRSLQDIQIGQSHSVEILFQLRRADWDWYNTNEEEIEDEIFEMLSESIIPRMFGDTIEQYHMKRNPHLFPENYNNNNNNNNNKIGSKNRKRAAVAGGANTKGNSKRKNNKGGAKPAPSLQVDEEEKKPEKDIYFSFGETVQLAYRKTSLPSPATKTIFFKEAEKDNGEQEKGGFEDFIKLPSRLLIWVSQIDPRNKTNPDPPGVGFYRPEMIPISSIFREPNDDDDEDD